MKIRPEIQGLRAIAVCLVIAGHAFPNLFPAGFIGVDIFFVISGYVITEMLARSLGQPFHTYLLDFYWRRARRILPSALLIILVTTFATFHILGLVTGSDTAQDGLWATLFLANIHFGRQALDYFASATPLPILQHYWSLAIEEQFYLVWPAIYYLCSKSKRTLKVSALGIVILSFCYALSQGGSGSPSNYFSTIARIWELGMGALISLMLKRRSVPLVPVISLVLMLETGIWGKKLDATICQLLAVISATVFISTATESFKVLTSKPIVYLGNISYLLYLIHWPLLQIPRLNVGTEISLSMRVILVTLTFILAATVHHFFENPIRYLPKLASSPKWSLISMATILIATWSTLRGLL